ncbi:DJ-1/PfpI family protein [Sessilibacter corallicola]|uniref:DJ-1/PfpI family protein n=1 Tax=Sessilibacter corallicola TaxID=2904075 RepID=A0ABQ0AB50_9GAMM
MNRCIRVFSVVLMAVLFSSHAFSGGKKIGILMYDGVLSSDVTAPLEVFGIAVKQDWFSEYEVVTIGVDKKNYVVSEEGIMLAVDASIHDKDLIDQLDVLLVSSRYDMDPLINDPVLISFIKKAADHVQWISSNCSGAFLLAEANVLDGKKATTWFGGEADLEKSYPKVKVQYDENVVVDGNIITSNGSVVSYQAALTLLKMMSDRNKAIEVADTIQYFRFSNAQF